MSTTAPQPRHTVTAIIVAHDGARLLPGLVQAVKAQTYRVDLTVGVDTGSRDRSGAVLAELIGPDAVFGMGRSTGYGEAVSAALGHAARGRSGRTDPRQVEWIWLLHDDCEPAPEALERLLRAAGRDRSVAVLGPKVLDGQDRRTLREAGVGIDRAGRRVTGIEPGEIDQGQHDHNRDVLAVSSAGMLIRRDVWDQLGGFDARLRFFRDDLDFCWRVQGAGYRVQVVTDSVLYHRELAARRRRPIDGGNARRLDRGNALFVLAVNLPLLAMLRIVGGCVIGTLLRGGYFVVTKQLDLAAAQFSAVAGLFGHPIHLFQARRRRARGHSEGYNAVRQFIPPARTLFKMAEKIAGLISNGPPQASGGLHQAASDDQEDEQFVDTQSRARQVISHPGVQLFVALLLIALIAERRLLGIGPLGGGALVPAWGGAGALWHEYLSGFHAVGVGSTASTPPYVAVVAALGTVLGGQAWLAVDVLLLGCVPLAGLTAYLAARRLVTSTAARVLLAASYALLPVATGAVAAGRLGTAVAFILLPLIAVSAGRMLTAPPRQARRAAWAVGLLVALAAAFAPLAWVIGVIFAAGVVAARRWLLSADPVNAAIVAVTPFFVLFPWSLHLITSPASLIAEAGLSSTGLTTAGLGPSQLLALSPGGPGLPPLWVTAGFGLAVLAALLPHRGRDLTIAGWIVALAGFLAAVVVRAVSLSPAGGGQAVAGWPGFALALAALGLLLATAPAAQWLAEIVKSATITANGPGRLPDAAPDPQSAPDPQPGHGPIRRALAAVALVAAGSAPLLVAGYWVSTGVRGPVGSISAPLLPAFVSASSTSGDQYRTLILRPDSGASTSGELDYMVVRQGDPTLGEPELTQAPAGERALSAEVAALGTANEADAGDPGLTLGQYGIKWVLLPGPVDPALAQQLDAAAGLVALSKAPTYDLWQVAGPVARVRAVAPDGTTTTLDSDPVDMSGVSAPAQGGTLVLAEPYGGWTATLNGTALKPLPSPVDGWEQGFVLPAGGGRLAITRNNLARDASLIAELIAVLAVALLALPGKRVAPAEEAQAMEALREARHGRRAANAANAGSEGEGEGEGAETGGGRRARRPGEAGRTGLGLGTGLGAGLAAPYRAVTRKLAVGKPLVGKLAVGKRRGEQDPRLEDAELEDAELERSEPGDAELKRSEPGRAAFPDARRRETDRRETDRRETEHREATATDDVPAGATTPAPAPAAAGRAADDIAEGPWGMAGDWDSAARWGTGPQGRAPWESGPQDPVSSTGPQQTGPQRSSQRSGSEQPVPWETVPPRFNAWEADSAWDSGEWVAPAWRQDDSSAVAGSARDDTAGRPATGATPAWSDTGAASAWDSTDETPQWPGTGEFPARRGTRETPAWSGTGETSAWSRTGELPPWPTSERDAPARPDEPAAAAPAAKPERHSHRAAKHGRPSRWRGGADRSGGDGDS